MLARPHYSFFLISRRLNSFILTHISRSNHLESLVNQNKENSQLESKEWTPKSQRTGVIAIKLGMSHLWTKTGYRIPVTLLQIIDNEVVRVKTKETDGYSSLQIGAVNHPKPHKVNKPTLGQYSKAGIPPKRKLQEFRVTEDALLPVGMPLYSGHFVAGQYVDVCGITIGKGFQGVMKRHGMKGQPASHGASKSHRKMGATGGSRNPGRIWPGKKMPGRMGCKKVTTQSLMVYRINHRFNVLYVKGAVPGHKNNYVRITDAKRKPHQFPPPFPTYFNDANQSLPEETYWEHLHQPHLPSLQFTDLTKKSK